MIGIGTITNVVAIVIGGFIGVALGGKFPERTSRTVMDGAGIAVLVLGGLNMMSLMDAAYIDAVSGSGTFLVVVVSVVFGGALGSMLNLEERIAGLGGFLHEKFSGGSNDNAKRTRFIDGFVNASLIMAVGPMGILGALSDGMGQGADTLFLKSLLDFIGSIAFGASMGIGVAASAVSVGLWQGLVTAFGAIVGAGIPTAYIASITATGGILMIGIGLRLLNIRQVAIADLLPALLIAPLLTWGVSAVL
ncbi:MAG: hypothetical protein RLZ72_587 [Actinomycetota bacterium]|jgi:uncharacterized membrane protein YqgA involved in biofilm formation